MVVSNHCISRLQVICPTGSSDKTLIFEYYQHFESTVLTLRLGDFYVSFTFLFQFQLPVVVSRLARRVLKSESSLKEQNFSKEYIF